MSGNHLSMLLYLMLSKIEGQEMGIGLHVDLYMKLRDRDGYWVLGDGGIGIRIRE